MDGKEDSPDFLEQNSTKTKNDRSKHEAHNQHAHHCTDETRVRFDRDKIMSQCPLMVSVLSSNLVYLLTLLSLYKLHRQSNKRTLVQSLINGIISSIVSQLVTSPLWVAQTRLSTKQRNSSPQSDCAKCRSPKPIGQLLHEYDPFREALLIGQSEGVGKLWSGLNTALLLASLNSPLQIIIYEGLRSQARKIHPSQAKLHTRIATIVCMMIVSRCSTVAITYPLQLIQSEQRHCKDSKPIENKSLWKSLLDILENQGPSGLYRGLGNKLTQTTILTALFAMTSPKIILQLLKLLKMNKILEHKLKTIL